MLIRDQYHDGGISGGMLERPSLQRLMTEIEDGLVDVLAVYKTDRLSRGNLELRLGYRLQDRSHDGPRAHKPLSQRRDNPASHEEREQAVMLLCLDGLDAEAADSQAARPWRAGEPEDARAAGRCLRPANDTIRAHIPLTVRKRGGGRSSCHRGISQRRTRRRIRITARYAPSAGHGRGGSGWSATRSPKSPISPPRVGPRCWRACSGCAARGGDPIIAKGGRPSRRVARRRQRPA